jgi:hypothetical protein
MERNFGSSNYYRSSQDIERSTQYHQTSDSLSQSHSAPFGVLLSSQTISSVTPACALGPKRPRCDSIWSHLAYISYLMSCFALLIFPLILPFSYRNCFVYKHCTGSRIQGASTELCSDTTDFPLHLAAGNLPPLTFPIHALGHTNSHALTSTYNWLPQ